MRILLLAIVVVWFSIPVLADAGSYELVTSSDDYKLYKDAFATAASNLIKSGKCSEGDFQEMGGWVKSTNHPDRPIYFTYCGGMTRANRLYLNAVTGEVFK